MIPQDSLSVFDGVGGWNVHDKELGLTTLGLEKDETAADTATKAGHNTAVVDVTGYELSGSHPYSGLKGSPPCGPWTVAGNGSGRVLLTQIAGAAEDVRLYGDIPEWLRRLDPEAALVLEPLRLAVQAFRLRSPFRWIVLEQTREVLPVWGAVAVELKDLGYSVAVGNLHAEQYGVPQTRTRAVLIASLDEQVKLPEPTHARYKSGQSLMDLYATDRGTTPWIHMAEALGLSAPAPGAYLRSNYGTGGVAANRGRRTLYQPAATITRKYNRNKWVLGAEVLGPMTEKQASVLQTFPVDYPWQGDATERQLQLGNAIPPLLARAILRQVL